LDFKKSGREGITVISGLLRQFIESSNAPVVSAFGLGLLTAMSPCPMATNIAAIAYVSRKVTERRYAVLTSVLYTFGRIFSYSLLGILIIKAGLDIPGSASFLQDFGERILGPLLIVAGLLMLNIDRISAGSGGGKLAEIGRKLADKGMAGAFLLGALFALAFCPYSAILFFGVLLPLAFESNAGIVMPAVFAIGTGLPVIVFGTLIVVGVAGVSGWLDKVAHAQKTIRVLVACTFIFIGIYYVWRLVQL
jgi:cytochrome c-type biogenesis protein